MAFIVFEGLDASGKSTLIQRLEDHLHKQEISSIVLRDPGTTPLGEKIRKIILDIHGDVPCPRAETLLYEAARVQMVEKSILPALADSKWVLCDRFYSSTVAFQVFARGLDLRDIESLNDFVARNCKPDLFVFLDISVDESQRRKAERARQLNLVQDRMEREDREFQEKVREGYLYQVEKTPDCWLSLDGNRAPEELLNQTLAEIRRRQWLS